MATKDFDLTHLQQWTVENDGSYSSVHVCNSEPEYTYTYDPEQEPIQELTFRQKMALKWIIFKAWVEQVVRSKRKEDE